jgi:methylmalonyl-CoA mutase N-terminal domain/subunit
MYREKLWTFRQYAGFGDAAATNRRFQDLLAAGQTGLSVAFDLPTQMGLDSDHDLARGEVGRVGVAIDTLDDMRRLLDGIDLGAVSTSMTINSTAAILLLLYGLVADERGVPVGSLRGTVQNDILKEYVARGTFIYPPRPSMRIVTDLFAYAAAEMPAWNTISISGYHIREAGATAVQEMGFTIANGIAYVEAAIAAGLDPDSFVPRLSFFWNAQLGLFEEVAKYRAARRLWARLMSERYGLREHPMRFHTQTAGSSLTAQQPEVNIVRTTVEALAAVLGGTQSLHTNAYDEALGLPSEQAARLALRTQQVLAYETGIADTVDPLAGSYFVEDLTTRLEEAAAGLIGEVDRLGGAVAAIEAGWMQAQIEESAYAEARRREAGTTVVVGVNRFVEEAEVEIRPLTMDPGIETEQVRRLAQHKAARSQSEVDQSLAGVELAAGSGDNLLYPMREALAAGATVGEVSDALRRVFGTHK